MKVEVHFMVALRPARRGYGRAHVRVLGPRTTAAAGELVVPMTLLLDELLLRPRVQRLKVEVPPVEPTRAVAGTPFVSPEGPAA